MYGFWTNNATLLTDSLDGGSGGIDLKYRVVIETINELGVNNLNIGFLVGGILLGLFAFAQLLQLLGLIGVGPSIAGVGITILSGVGSYACFNKAKSG